MKRYLLVSILIFAYIHCGAQIKINRYYGDPVNSAGGQGVTIEFVNTSGKEMKYVTFNVSFYNRVDDLLACSISGGTEFHLEFVGPVGVKPLNKCRSGYFLVMYNHQSAKMGINSVDIEYMDGCKDTITDMQTVPGYKGVKRNSIDRSIYL